MADAAQTLKILLQVQADVADLKGKLNPALDETKQKLGQTGDAAGNISPIIGGIAASLGIGFAAALASIPIKLVAIGEEVRRLSEEQLKQTQNLDDQVTKYIQIAKLAKDAGDVVSLGNALAGNLKKSEENFDEFRKKELSAWDTFWNNLTTIPFISPQGILKPAFDADKAAAEQAFRTSLVLFNSQIALANETAAAFQRIKTEPVAQGIAEVTAKITSLQAEVVKLTEQKLSEDLHKAAEAAQEFANKSALLNQWQNLLIALQKEVKKLADDLRDLAFDATAAIQGVNAQIASSLAAASGNETRILDTKLEQLRVSTQIALQEKGTDPVTAARLAEQLVNAKRQEAQHAKDVKDAAAGARDAAQAEVEARRDIVTFLTEESALLQVNRQKQQQVEQNPFLSIDQKNTQMAQLLAQEISEINAKVAEGRSKIAGTV
jgi:hypothetical protein